MNAEFQDLQNERNRENGRVFGDGKAVKAFLEQLRTLRPPFMCQFVSDNGFNLTVGIDREFGCAQHTSNDGMPPYLMAVSRAPDASQPDMEFVVGGTATPIDGRYRLEFETLAQVVSEFVSTGRQSDVVSWEDLD
jgi:hypothetical protein